MTAGGGGDTPEALDEALHGAVNGPAWDSEDAVQLAQYSLGTFFFLTYGADGRSPGDSTDLDVKASRPARSTS